MPNAGIQAWRSTNWKSAEVGSNRAHSSSVTANTSSDTTSATFRISASCASSSSHEQQQERADDRQSDERVERIGERHRPQVVAEDQHDARGTATPRTPAPSRSAGGAARRSAPPTVSPTPLTAPSMTPHVDALPQPCSDDDADRLHDGGVVDLVDVVLVHEQRAQAGERVAATASDARRGSSGRRTHAMPMPASATPTTAHQRELDAGVGADARPRLRSPARRFRPLPARAPHAP